MFESDEEILIELLLLAAGLMGETLPLFDRVVLFRVGRGDLLTVDTAFKDLNGFRIVRSQLVNNNRYNRNLFVKIY